jgi:hypothetical protein
MNELLEPVWNKSLEKQVFCGEGPTSAEREGGEGKWKQVSTPTIFRVILRYMHCLVDIGLFKPHF